MSTPLKVTEAYEKLKKEYPFYVALKKINGKYYLYKQTSHADENKKVKVITEYLGRVKDDGVFIKKVISKDTELENAKTLILARGGKVILPERTEEGEYLPVKELMSDEIDKKILTTLSMNARASLAFMGRQIGLSQNATYNRVKHLEEKYGIRYMAEINVEKLGFLPLLIMVKFIDKSPSIKEVIDALKDESRVQLVFTTKGDYDLVIYALAKNVTSEETIDTVVKLRMGGLIKYPGKWYVTLFWKHSLGYIPLRDEFIDSIKDNLLKREYAILKELNKNGIMDFTEIDKKYGFDNGRSQYTYYRLKEKGIISRITISEQELPIKYVGVILKEIIDEKKFRKNRVNSLLDILDETNFPTTKYILTGDYGNPDGSILFMPIFNPGHLEANVEKLSSFDLGLNIRTWIITNILLGSFCFRKFDLAYASQYGPLEREYGIKRPTMVDYEITGKAKIRGTKSKEFTIDLNKPTENLEEDD
jgi:DNA-binding Lrp family transcriptional regulator